METPDQVNAIRKPCIICGVLTVGNSRCEQHRLEIDNARYRRRGPRAHYEGDYRKRSAKVRREAQTCWICGGGPIDGDPWTADHVTPGDPESDLLPSHRSCNSRRGDAGKRQRERERNKKLF